MRLFVGLRPSDAALGELAGFVPGLRLDGLRVTALDTWHLTLAFIGELDEHRLDDVVSALTEASRGTDPFELRLTGGKILGRSATALCVGVDGDTGALHGLVADVRDGLARFAVPYDDRDFSAHLTLARGGDRGLEATLAPVMAALDTYRGEPWTTRELLLYRSRMGPPVSYDVVRTFPL